MRQPSMESKGIGFVYHVVDGDTIRVFWAGESVTVRLEGIDAPETNHPKEMDGYYGKEAYEATAQLALGKYVWLETSGLRDSYDRLIAVVYLENGEMLNEWLVSNGFAREKVNVENPCKYRDRFVLAEQKAREELRGMWRYLLGGLY